MLVWSGVDWEPLFCLLYLHINHISDQQLCRQTSWWGRGKPHLFWWQDLYVQNNYLLKTWEYDSYTFTDESYLDFGCLGSFFLIDVVWCETTYVMPQSWFMMLCLATSTSVDVLTFTLSAETGESGECSLVTDNCSIHSAQLTEYCHVSSLTPAHTLLHPHHQLERSSNSVRVSVVYSVQSASPFLICSYTHFLLTLAMTWPAQAFTLNNNF